MNLLLFSVVILSLSIDTRCGVVVNLFEKMKNTTSDIKDDIKGLISTGKEMVFGGHSHEGAENMPDCHNSHNFNEKKNEGVIAGLFRKVHDKVDNLKQNVHNMFSGNAEHPNIVESTTKVNKIVGASDKVDLQYNKNEKPTNPIQNPKNDTSVDSDNNFNFSIDVRDAFSKGNNTVQNVKKNVGDTVNKIKNTVKNTEQEVMRDAKDIQGKEQK